MSRPIFTAEELAELAAFDAAVDADDTVTLEERKEARARDIAAKQRAENREAIAEKARQYRAENRSESGRAMRQWRKDHGYTQKELARLLGVCQATVSNWEAGLSCKWNPGEEGDR